MKPKSSQIKCPLSLKGGPLSKGAVFLATLVVASSLNSGCAGGGVARDLGGVLSARWTIKAENTKLGTTAWQITNPATNREIEGFASLTSVNRGEDISIFVNTAEPTYMMEIFRLGWYSGMGGRAVAPPIIRTGTRQPMPLPDPETRLVECQWDDPYVLHILNSSDPTEWASGIYLVKLTGGSSGKQRYVIFVVRDDERSSDLLFQSSVTTYEAYNQWGGWSLYTRPRAYKVSFNRPFVADEGAGHLLLWEYNMVRFLEREGYDVTYSTDVDTHVRGQLLLQHTAFLSVGHDEYWSWQMRDNVERARDNGVSLGFFGANTAYWQIRLEPSPATGDPDRTIVCYKSASLDPVGGFPRVNFLTTTQFRKPPVNRPEDALIGVMYESWFPFNQREDIVIEDGSSWVFENTGLKAGDHLTGLLGYEADRTYDHAPWSTRRIAHSPYHDIAGRLLYSDMTFYVTPAGSTVVATGSMDWNWGLDDFARGHPVLTNPALQRATRNILKRFGATEPASIPPPAN